MENTQMKEIYTRALAKWLREQGFLIREVKVNPYRIEFDMYLFDDTPELQAAIERYKVERTK